MMSNRATTGQPAKEAVRKYFREAANPSAGDLLFRLDQEGLIVVPKLYCPPARRGNEEPLLGKSHTANLVGGRA